MLLLLTEQITNKKIKIKMSCYHFNRKETLQKAKERYSKEKAGYYLQNKESIKEKSKNRYKNLSKEESNKIKSTKEKGIRNWFGTKKKHYKTNESCFYSV